MKPIGKYWIHGPCPFMFPCSVSIFLYNIEDKLRIYYLILLPLIPKEIMCSTQTHSASVSQYWKVIQNSIWPNLHHITLIIWSPGHFLLFEGKRHLWEGVIISNGSHKILHFGLSVLLKLHFSIKIIQDLGYFALTNGQSSALHKLPSTFIFLTSQMQYKDSIIYTAIFKVFMNIYSFYREIFTIF